MDMQIQLLATHRKVLDTDRCEEAFAQDFLITVFIWNNVLFGQMNMNLLGLFIHTIDLKIFQHPNREQQGITVF